MKVIVTIGRYRRVKKQCTKTGKKPKEPKEEFEFVAKETHQFDELNKAFEYSHRRFTTSVQEAFKELREKRKICEESKQIEHILKGVKNGNILELREKLNILRLMRYN